MQPPHERPTRPRGTALEGANALLVIDMQNAFLHPRGSIYQYRDGMTLLGIERTIANTAQAVEMANQHAIPVIYTRHSYRSDYLDASPVTKALFHRMGTRPLLSGTWDAQVIDELPIRSESLVVDKTRFDAFYNSDLEVLLRGIGGNHLVVTGIVTNACVETTTRAAAMRDFDVTILADCCTTYSNEHQLHALEVLDFYMLAKIDTLLREREIRKGETR